MALVFICGAAATDLVIEGYDGLGRKEIEPALGFPDDPGEMTREDWTSWGEEAAQAVADLYRENGFFEAEINIDAEAAESGVSGAEPGVSEAEPGGGGVNMRVRVRIREGPHFRFGKVEVVPSSEAGPTIDPGDLKSRIGKEFDKDAVFRDRRLILSRFGNAGYLHSRASESIEPDTALDAVNLRFTVETGHPVVFDTLVIRNIREGDTLGTPGVTRTKLLRSLLNLGRGDTVGLGSLGKFERKLKSTRVFNYVRIKDSLLGEERGYRSALILSTEERIPGEMDVSFFYETQYGFGVGLNTAHGNMKGMLHEGRLGGSVAQKRQSVYLGYASPLFFGSSIRFDNDLVANWYQDSRLQREAGLYEGDLDITNSSRISRALSSWSRYVGNTELTGKRERIDTSRVLEDFNLNFINSAFFQFLDHVANPNKGMRWSIIWGNGGRFLENGEIQAPITRRHNWLEGESGYYLPVVERLKLAFRLDGGRFFGDGGINSERFFLGGPRSVRSFGWRRVCPEQDSATGICVKSGVEPAYFLTSFEMRASPFSSAYINPDGRLGFLLSLQVVPFLDYGNVWRVGRPLTREGRGQAFGLGLRYALLSIFNLRLDYAVDGLERRHTQWVLDLAQAF